MLVFGVLCYTLGMTKHKIKNGRLFDNDVRLEVHERRTVDYLLQQGKDIELISPSYNLYSKSPDFWMDGVAWELKCPCVTKLERISYLFRYATKQSPQVIFDLRNIKGDSAGVIKHLQKLFHISRRVRRLIIISKEGNLQILKLLAKQTYCTISRIK